jgi:hypothetical protein
MSMTDEVYDSLSEEELEGLRDKVRQYEQEPGFIGKLFGEEKGFKEMVFAPYQLENMNEVEFYKLLDAAPAFQFNEAESYRGRGRLYMTPQTVVENYQNGGPVGPPEDPQGDMFPEAIREGIGTLVEYAPKIAKVAGRGIGDLVRSEPVSPPEFAVSRPTELTEFQMDTEILEPEELDMISDSVIGKLYSDEVVNTLEDPEERAGLFLYADKPGVTDAPPKSKLLRDTVRRSLEEQKQAFDKMKAEGRVGIRTDAPLFSRTEAMKNVFNVLRDQIGPQAMSRIGDDRLLKMVEQSVRQASVQRFADGGVVSLKDRAVNMTRGPRTNGIMEFVPYMTGASYGY